MGCFTFVKVMMILFNFIIFLVGVVLLALGVWETVNGSVLLHVLGHFQMEPLKFINLGYYCISMGAILILLGLLGCFGAHKENKCLLIMFFSIVMLIFIAEAAAAVITLAYSSAAESVITEHVGPILHSHYGTDPVVTEVWNVIMIEFECCGLSNYTDFANYSLSADSYPPTCCKDPSTNCSQQAAFESIVKGCAELMSAIKKDADTFGGIAAGVCALEVVAMAVSMYLYWFLDNVKR